MAMPPLDRTAYNEALFDVMKEIIKLRTKMMDQEVLDHLVQTAVLAEREACAYLADTVAREIDNTNNTASYIANAIRARTDNK